MYIAIPVTVLNTIFEQKYTYILLGLLLILLFLIILLLIPQTRKIIKSLLDRILKISVEPNKTAIEFSQKFSQHKKDSNNSSKVSTANNTNMPQPDVEIDKSIIQKTKIFNIKNLKIRTSILCNNEFNNAKDSNDANYSK